MDQSNDAPAEGQKVNSIIDSDEVNEVNRPGKGETTVNSSPHATHATQVNRSRMGRQQLKMVRAIALVEPSRRGLYLTAGIFDKVGTTGSRSESASLSRALCRLAERGVVERDDGFFTLTEAGCALVNEVRAERGLSPLTYTPYVPEPPMSQEEIQRRLQERCLLIERLREEWQVLDTPKALANAKKEAEKMTPAGLEELRRWIEARQAAQNG